MHYLSKLLLAPTILKPPVGSKL
ncbi:UNVERIFIED_CONTAM: hypothetical protein GTU68_062539 [Idotea baltica]|nr:hypothetical protein [Idotea baltica]